MDYGTLLENVMDVSHVPFTHHNSVGKRENATPVVLEMEGKLKPGGFTAGGALLHMGGVSRLLFYTIHTHTHTRRALSYSILSPRLEAQLRQMRGAAGCKLCV